MTKLTCSHCGKPIKHSVMSPTLDKKRRNQCVECAREWLDTKKKGLTPTPNRQSEWDKEIHKILQEEIKKLEFPIDNVILKGL